MEEKGFKNILNRDYALLDSQCFQVLVLPKLNFRDCMNIYVQRLEGNIL